MGFFWGYIQHVPIGRHMSCAMFYNPAFLCIVQTINYACSTNMCFQLV